MHNIKFDFKEKNVVITGASQGIGLAIANSFLDSGANVINLSKSPKEIKNSQKYQFVQLDVTDIKSMKNWIASFTKKKKIDVWINNAGLYPQAKLLDVSEEQWDKTFDTNLKSLFFISAFVAKHMGGKRKGVIINASSIAAFIPSIGNGIYGASKAAVSSLTKSMAAEWAPYGIRVNSYCPGVIMTHMTKSMIAKKKGKLLEPIALSRFGNPDEVAQLVLFLCSDAASYITGANVEITGGKLIVQNQYDA